MPDSEAFIQYLLAKRSVEDRALNARVWAAVLTWFEGCTASPLKVLEPGAGIGSMFFRFLDTRSLQDCHYTVLDPNVHNLEYAKGRVWGWGEQNNVSVIAVSDDVMNIDFGRSSVRIEFVCDEVQNYLGNSPSDLKWDLIIAHALLDLLDLEAILPQLFGHLEPEGAYYFPINFDGVTIFEPEVDPDLDRRIIACYHETMDDRLVAGKRSGDSRTGRRLFQVIRNAGGQVLAAGSSDWVVFPVNKRYPADEAFFLSFILDTIEGALADHPGLDPLELESWLTLRRSQLEAGELIFIAHQLDFFGVR